MLIFIDTLNDDILKEDPKTLDENSDKTMDLTNTSASTMVTDDSEESLNCLLYTSPSPRD